jgi:hypothetical protein
VGAGHSGSAGQGQHDHRNPRRLANPEHMTDGLSNSCWSLRAGSCGLRLRDVQAGQLDLEPARPRYRQTLLGSVRCVALLLRNLSPSLRNVWPVNGVNRSVTLSRTSTPRVRRPAQAFGTANLWRL